MSELGMTNGKNLQRSKKKCLDLGRVSRAGLQALLWQHGSYIFLESLFFYSIYCKYIGKDSYLPRETTSGRR